MATAVATSSPPLAHRALADALAAIPTASSSSSRSQTPPPRLDTLASPFASTPVSSSRCSSPSYHTARNSPRPRPLPITIPAGSGNEPLFSSYPISGDGIVSRPDLAARRPSAPVSYRTGSRDRSGDTGSAEHTLRMRTAQAADSSVSVSRRRSLSTLGLVKRAHDQAASFGKPPSPGAPPRRRASLGAGESDNSRTDMATVAAYDHNLPYGYGRDHDLEPKSQPTALDPVQLDAAILGLEKMLISKQDIPKRSTSLLFKNNVPPRSSSLLYEKNLDTGSVVSVSDPSLSSPSILTKSLPSTKTSLSRSVRSGKESIDDDEKRSETRQVLLDKRRMILLEIVETEVTYVHALRALVHIYLPQLAALPHVSEHIHHHIASNTNELLDFHVQLAAQMVTVFKENEIGYEACGAAQLDTATKDLAELLVRENQSFTLYNDYCSSSTAATAIIREIAHRPDYEAFEKRCQYIGSTTPQATLQNILRNEAAQTARTRLRFKDILIAPIQRVCRYPLLLGSLLADVNRDLPPSEVVTAVEGALGVMRAVAENADDARQRKEAELKTSAVANRLEAHPGLPNAFVRQLGTCRLIGALDVLYHHPQRAPLDRPPAKVRYLAAFLYRGYLILAKAKKNKGFEVRHFLPLEVLEIIDITEGSLRHSLRLAVRDHNFDIGCSCPAEKELWAAELAAARDESTVPPFEMPSSIPLFVQRARHGSSAGSRPSVAPPRTPSKRYTLMSTELSPMKDDSPASSKRNTLVSTELTDSPVDSTFEFPTDSPEYRKSLPSTVLLRVPSLTTRLQVDRVLSDVVSESLATAKSKAQLHNGPPSDPKRISALLDTPMLRRRRSLAEMRSVESQVRGAVIPGHRPRSLVRTRSFVLDAKVDDTLTRNTSFSSINEDRPSRTTGGHMRTSSFTASTTRQRATSGPGHVRAVSASGARTISGSGYSRNTLGRALEMTGFGQKESNETGSGSSSGTERTERPQPASTAAVSADSSPSTPPRKLSVDVPNQHSVRSLARSRSMPSSPAGPDMEAAARSKSNQPHKRGQSDDFVLVPLAAPDSEEPSPSLTPRRTIKVRRSLSFFGRKLDEDDSPLPTLDTRARSTPSTPDASPTTPKRRRSLKLLGQLRGFTPI